MTPIDVPGTFNVRDAACGNVLPGRLFRSGTIDALTPDGVTALGAFGIRAVVDLRADTEKRYPDADRPWEVVAAPVFDPADGLPIRGTIDGLYDHVVSRRGPRIAAAVRAIAHAPGPVLVHCTAGKDRTGLVVALALSSVGVERSAVLADYAASGAAVRAHRTPEVLALLAGETMSDSERRASLEMHLDSPAPALQKALDAVTDRFGSPADYLLAHGLTVTDLEALHGRLCSAAAPAVPAP